MSKTSRQLAVAEGVFVHVDEYGEDRGTNRVLALHGWMDNAGTFARLAPKLSAAPLNWYIVAVDFPGHGRSFHKGPTSTYAFMELVQDTFLVVQKLRWTSCTVLGHSMGGAVGFMLAALASEETMKVERLIVLDNPGPFSHLGVDPSEAVRSARDAIRANLQRLEQLNDGSEGGGRSKRQYGSVDEAAAVRSKMDPFLSPADARHLVEPALRQTEQGTFEFLHDVRIKSRSLTRFREDEVVQMFRAIECPVFCVYAEFGIIVQALKHEKHRKVIEARLAGIHNYSERTVPKAGHHLHLTHADEVFDCIKEFIFPSLTISSGL